MIRILNAILVGLNNVKCCKILHASQFHFVANKIIIHFTFYKSEGVRVGLLKAVAPIFRKIFNAIRTYI